MNKVQALFISNLQQLIGAKGLNQRRFAALIKRSPETVNRWIKAVNEPSMGDIDSICDKLGVSIDALFGREQKFVITARDASRYLKDALNDPDVFEDVTHALSGFARKVSVERRSDLESLADQVVHSDLSENTIQAIRAAIETDIDLKKDTHVEEESG